MTPISERARMRTTPWAYASLICSLSIFCPLLTLIGPLLGLKAVAEIRARPGVGGMRVAVVGIVIGLAVSIAWVIFAIWWHHNVRRPMIDGPIAEIHALQRGDVGAFRAAFIGEGATAGDLGVLEFASTMTGRYGLLLGIAQDRNPEADASGEHRFDARIPYVFHFETGPQRGIGQMSMLADGLRPRWRAIVIFDEDRGDLVYPRAAQQWLRTEEVAPE